uniref:Uncharacterized protein n=1 Tax=Arundo donax TaxID=35708 RepID=A0A0A9G098_ARUDO
MSPPAAAPASVDAISSARTAAAAISLSSRGCPAQVADTNPRRKWV